MNSFDEGKFNITDPLDHVNTEERCIQIIKERIRCLVESLPFRHIPKFVTKRLTEVINRNINQFPNENSISNVCNSLCIVTKRSNPACKDFLIDFGSYAKMHESNGWARNSNKLWANSAACLDLTLF